MKYEKEVDIILQAIDKHKPEEPVEGSTEIFNTTKEQLLKEMEENVEDGISVVEQVLYLGIALGLSSHLKTNY